MTVKTYVENRLFSPHNAFTKAFTTNLRFLRGFAMRSLKTRHEHVEQAMPEVKTQSVLRDRLRSALTLARDDGRTRIPLDELIDNLIFALDCDPGHDATDGLVGPCEDRTTVIDTYRRIVRSALSDDVSPACIECGQTASLNKMFCDDCEYMARRGTGPSDATQRMAKIMGCEFVSKRAYRHFYQAVRVEIGPHYHECIHCGHVR